ncbi:MAG: mechanosensitive ion channel [Clostridiales bacterium]|nr:mechanosensitive ion channel [Clostridiales bacterium]
MDISSWLSALGAAMASNTVNVILTAVFCYIVARIVLRIVFHALDAMPIEMTLVKFAKNVIRIVVYVVVILIILDRIGFQTSSLVALISVLSAAFALAAQNALSNLFGGILLLINKPFLVGDYISAGGVEGTVLEIGLLNTQINTYDNKRISIPNGTISAETITNLSTEGCRRVEYKVTASYDAPIELTKKALMEAIEATNGILDVPEAPAAPFARVNDYGESSIEYVVRVWTNNATYWAVYFDLIENIKVAFDNNGVEMTYNHLNVHMMEK